MGAHTTNITVITTGIVRNMQKTPYYLRVPAEKSSLTPVSRGSGRTERTGRTIKIPSTEDIELDYRDWKLVEHDLMVNHNLGILRIIRYPAYAAPSPALTVINNYFGLPPSPPPPGTIVWVQYGGYQGIFYYDETRNEWLSENETTMTWTSSTNSDVVTVNLVSNSDDTKSDNDYQPKNPITVTGMAASQVNPLAVGNVTRFELNVYELLTGNHTPSIATLDLTTVGERGVNNTSLNIPIDAGMIISANRIKLSGTDTVTRPSLTAWYRERLTP